MRFRTAEHQALMKCSRLACDRHTSYARALWYGRTRESSKRGARRPTTSV